MHRVGAGFLYMDLFDLEAKASPRMMHFANKPTTSMPEEIVVSLLWLASEVTCWSVASVVPWSVGAEAAVLL